MKLRDVVKAMQTIESDRSISKDVVVEALREALAKAYRKHIEIPDCLVRVDIEEKSSKLIPTEVFSITSSKEEPVTMQLAIERSINRRQLENLDALDFDFGLRFVNEGYMPFFTENDTALFKRQGDDFDTGDMCLLEFKIGGARWLGFAEENGFFSLDGDYLGDDEDLKILGTLVNIESRE